MKVFPLLSVRCASRRHIFMLWISADISKSTSRVKDSTGGGAGDPHTTWIGTESNSSNEVLITWTWNHQLRNLPAQNTITFHCSDVVRLIHQERMSEVVSENIAHGTPFLTLCKSSCDSAILSLLQRCCLGNRDNYPRSNFVTHHFT